MKKKKYITLKTLQTFIFITHEHDDIYKNILESIMLYKSVIIK